LLTNKAEYPFSSGGLPILQSPESFSIQLSNREHYVEAVRTTKHPSSKIATTNKKGPQNRRHSTCKVARAPRSHDFYDVKTWLVFTTWNPRRLTPSRSHHQTTSTATSHHQKTSTTRSGTSIHWSQPMGIKSPGSGIYSAHFISFRGSIHVPVKHARHCRITKRLLVIV